MLNITKSDLELGMLIFLGLIFIATLFPPYEWNHSVEGVTSGAREKNSPPNGTYYSYHSKSYKTYDFLFGSNRKQFVSSVTKEKEIFTRSLILSELFTEYVFAAIISTIIAIILNHLKKKREINTNKF